MKEHAETSLEPFNQPRVLARFSEGLTPLLGALLLLHLHCCQQESLPPSPPPQLSQEPSSQGSSSFPPHLTVCPMMEDFGGGYGGRLVVLLYPCCCPPFSSLPASLPLSSLFCLLNKNKNGGLKQTPREEQQLGECIQYFSKYFPSLQLLQNQKFSQDVQQSSFSNLSVKPCNLPESIAPFGKECYTSAIH